MTLLGLAVAIQILFGGAVFGMDVIVPAGDGISLFLSQTGEDYVPSPVSTAPVTITADASSILGLSTVDRTCVDLFLPPMMENYPFCNN